MLYVGGYWRGTELALCDWFTYFVVMLAVFLSVFRTEIMSQSGKQTPSDFLKQIIGRPVVVKLNSGIDYRGL